MTMPIPKCQHRGGVTVYLFGQEVDPCRYVDIEVHENVDVTVAKCKYCGDIDISFKKRPETISRYLKRETSDDDEMQRGNA